MVLKAFKGKALLSYITHSIQLQFFKKYRCTRDYNAAKLLRHYIIQIEAAFEGNSRK